MLPSFQGSSGPYSPGSFPNRVGPDSPGIWSRFLLPSVPGTEEAGRGQSLHLVTEGGRQEHPCPRRQRLMGGSSAVGVRSLVHHQEQRTHQHSPWVPSSGWEPKGDRPGRLRIGDSTGGIGELLLTTWPSKFLASPELSGALLDLPKPGFILQL